MGRALRHIHRAFLMHLGLFELVEVKGGSIPKGAMLKLKFAREK
jgi:hypothetical protein